MRAIINGFPKMSGKAGEGRGKPSEKRRRSGAKTRTGEDEESKVMWREVENMD